ncbi:MAG: hypothetical protein IT440_10220 [Phycisphaeraceae bacterium]|nr:hypothetical protein [Phycisphaeraceae bacterium]
MMKKTMHTTKALFAAAVTVGLGLLAAGTARAHCDTMNGPLIPEAQAALGKGDVTPILKWVKKDSEAEIRAAFAQAVAVRAQGPEAKELADRYFLETLVRVHRAGEGAPYTGLKDEPVEPIVALADNALAEGSPQEMIKQISAHMALAVQDKFDQAVEAGKNKDKSVEAGREYVEAYVTYMHYVEGIHAAVMSAGDHRHAGEAAGHKEHDE